MDRRHGGSRDTWSARLARALATCRVFVPLYSPRYFESEDCGKEWFAFTRRPLSSPAQGRGVTEAIIPVLWEPLGAGRLPAAARSVRSDHTDLGKYYAAHGCYGIIKLTRYRDAYESAVDGLARRIVQAAEKSPVTPEPVTDYTSLVSAFGSEATSMPGGRRLRITVAAPRRAELPRDRGASHYGHEACGWNPYGPEAVRGLADHAAEIARGLGYRPEVGDLGQHGQVLLRGGAPSSPEVLVVDAWAATMDGYASLLRRLDAMNKPWVQVIVPWNSGDAENEAAKARLWAALDSVLGRMLAQGRATSLCAVRGVPTLDDFSQVLPAVIMAAARHYLRHAPAFPPAAAPEVARPLLSFSLPDPSNAELSGA